MERNFVADRTVFEDRGSKTTSDGDRPPGRPPCCSELLRSERLVTFVTPGEYEVIQEMSRRWGLSLSATVYRLLSQFIRKTENGNETHT